MPHKDPEARAAYNREYSRRHRESLNEQVAKWRRDRYATDPEYRAKVKATTAAIPKHVHAAHQRVHTAVKRGELVRPDSCPKCGGGGPIEAAHLNYYERLAIIWLCQPCHRLWDMEQPKVIDDRRYVAPPTKSHCKHGHEFTEANTYRPPGSPNRRYCRTCHMQSERRRRENE
jgi:hypothetical protein